MKKLFTILALFALTATFAQQETITIDDVKNTIGLEGSMKTALVGLCDVWYKQALQNGMSPSDAASDALVKLGDKLLELGEGLSVLDSIIPKQSSFIDPMLLHGSVGHKTWLNDMVPLQHSMANIPLHWRSGDKIYNVATGEVVADVQTKKDTIFIPVICQFHTWAEVWTLDESGSNGSSQSMTGVRVETKRQERTLEWETWYETNNGSRPISTYKSDWVAKELVWLDPTDKCYHLIPIQDR